MGLDHSAGEFDINLCSGRIRCARLSSGGPLVLCVPGLSANLRSFDFIGGQLAERGFQVVAVDLRGRGRSETTPPGTYGWPRHAADVIQVAQRLGVRDWYLIGWSMGAFVAMHVARIAPHLLTRVVLIDACGVVNEPARAVIGAAIDRLGIVYSSSREYIQMVRQLGIITPWHPLWERYLEYDLETVAGGVRTRTSREAVHEDFEYVVSHDPRHLWPGLTMPTLLLRAARPLGRSDTFIVSDKDRDEFARSVGKVVEVDANHYGVMTHVRTAEPIAEFLNAPT